MEFSLLRFIPIIKTYLLAYMFTYLLFSIYSLARMVGSFMDSSFNKWSGASQDYKRKAICPFSLDGLVWTGQNCPFPETLRNRDAAHKTHKTMQHD